MLDKNYNTSVSRMREIIKADIERHSTPDTLRTYQHDPAPTNLGNRNVVGPRTPSESGSTVAESPRCENLEKARHP